MRNGIAAVLLCSAALFLSDKALLAQSASPQAGQATGDQQGQLSIDQQIQMLRKDLRSQRKQIIAANMTLTPIEAEKFWPIYEQYVGELVSINNTKYQVIKEYAGSENLTDQQVDSLAQRWLGVDESVAQLRRKYLPIFRNVLSAKHAARFFQIDRRVQLMIDLQLAASLPLVEPH